MHNPPPQTTAKVRKWQWLQVAAGLALVVLFFMPIGTPGAGTSPARFLLRVLEHGFYENTPLAIVDRMFFEPAACAMFIAAGVVPYAFGVVVVLGAIARIDDYRWLRSFALGLGAVALFTGAYCILIWIAIQVLYHLYPIMYGLFYYDLGFGRFELPWHPGCFWPVAAILLRIYVSRILRSRERSLVHIVFAGSLLLAIWFAALLSMPETTLGNYVALVASLVMLVAVVSEFRLQSRSSYGEAIKNLLLCRVPDYRNLCPDCRYNLYGLTEQRCPECGRAFTFEELGVSPEQLGFAGATAEPSSGRITSGCERPTR